MAWHIQRLKRQHTALRTKYKQIRAQHCAVGRRQKELERVTCELLRLGAV